MRFRLKTLRAGWGPVGGDVEIRPGDREVLNPLFEMLRDRRALLGSSHGRGHQAVYVTESIRAIREQLTQTVQRLEPDSDARAWVERLRAACREYLSEVESASHDDSDFEPALAQLRAAFFEVANHAAAYYRIPAARELATEMAANRDVPVEDEARVSEDGSGTPVAAAGAADLARSVRLEPSLLKGQVYGYHYLPAVEAAETALCLRAIAAVGIPDQPEPVLETEDEELFERLLAHSDLERWIVDTTSRGPLPPSNVFWRPVHPTGSTIVTLRRPRTVTTFGGWTVEAQAGLNIRPYLTMRPGGIAWINVDVVVRPDTENPARSRPLSLEDLFVLLCTVLRTVVDGVVPAIARQLIDSEEYELRAVETVLSLTGSTLGMFVPLTRSNWSRAEGAFDPPGGEWSLETVSEVEDLVQRTETVRRWYKTLLRNGGIRGHEGFVAALPDPG